MINMLKRFTSQVGNKQTNDAIGLQAAIDIIQRAKFVQTTHKQYGGEFEGETLTKLYRAGPPSYLAMLRENGDLISLKRGAKVIYEASQ